MSHFHVSSKEHIHRTSKMRPVEYLLYTLFIILDKLDSSEDIIKAYDGMIEEDYDEVQTDGGDIAIIY